MSVLSKDIELFKKASIISIVAITTILSVFEMNPFFQPYMKAANLGIQNTLISQYGTNKIASKDITIVTIDDKTLSDNGGLGRWQDFRRSYYAQVIDHLKRDGALVIGTDILFSEKSKEANGKDDVILAKSIKNAGNVILGFSLGSKANTSIYPLAELRDASAGLGYFDPLIIYANKFVYGFQPVDSLYKPTYEGFSFAITRKYFDYKNDGKSTPLDHNATKMQGYYLVTNNNKEGQKLYVPFVSDNINEGVFINYTQTANFQKISFSDVYNDNGEYAKQKDWVQGKIVLIGSTALGLHDEFYTPNGTMQGVFLHANMINTMLNENFITKVSTLHEILFLIILTFLLVIFILKVSNKLYQIIIVIIMTLIMTAFEGICFVAFGKLFNFPIELFIIILGITIGTTLYKYFHEEKWKRALKWALSQYLSEELVVNILDKFEEVKLDGKRMNITSFFSDIAGFTSISENMEPEELVHFLSIYLKEVSDIIMHDKGFINKYEWDAVMALWWAFWWDEKEQAILACRAALRQQEKIQELNQQFLKNHGFEISVRMGINKGVAVVGNIGSVGKKIEYTALGDSVNTASRFEGINKLYGTLICVGESVMEESKSEFVFRKLDAIQVKGKEKPVHIYELVGEKGKVPAEKLAIIEAFEKGLAFYVAWDLPSALKEFQELFEKDSDTASFTFITRCKKLIENGLPEGWQGVYRATEK